jgi:hypothetical protein
VKEKEKFNLSTDDSSGVSCSFSKVSDGTEKLIKCVKSQIFKIFLKFSQLFRVFHCFPEDFSSEILEKLVENSKNL